MKQVSFFLIAVLTITGCKKEANTPNSNPPLPPPPPPAANLSISGIKPATGAYNTAVTITGTSFSSTLADDSVYFNGVAALLNSANDSQLVAVVQKYTGTGDVVVKVGGVAKTGPLFTYIWTALETPYAGIPNADMFTGTDVDGPASQAGFFRPAGLVLDNSGNLFVFDAGNSKIREITPPVGSAQAQVSTYATTMPVPTSYFQTIEPPYLFGLAGQGGVFFADGQQVSTATAQEWNPAPNLSAGGNATPFPTGIYWAPTGAFMDASGNLYVGTRDNVVIIYKNGPASWASIGTPLQAGDQNGTFVFNVLNQPVPADEPSFDGPTDVVTDAAGNIYVADQGNNQIREITPAGVVSTFAGSGNSSEQNGTGTAASFAQPTYITMDSSSNFYVLDYNYAGGQTLRKITPSGQVSTLCTQCSVAPGGIVSDPAGHTIYVSEYDAGVINQISVY
jgi:serine/threonine protein kinase, bacterial